MLATMAGLLVLIQEVKKHDWHNHKTPSAGRKTCGATLSLLAARRLEREFRLLTAVFRAEKRLGRRCTRRFNSTDRPTTAKRVDFCAFINQWLEEHARNRCTPKTLERYTQLSRYAISQFGETDLHSLTPNSIEGALSALRNSGGRKTRRIRFVIHSQRELSVTLAFYFTNP
jgi:hypothetical protein